MHCACFAHDTQVATKRVTANVKMDKPLLDDRVSKLKHVGKAVANKLADLRRAFKHGGLCTWTQSLGSRALMSHSEGQLLELRKLIDDDSDLTSKVGM